MSEEGFLARWSRRKRAAGEGRDDAQARARTDGAASPPAQAEEPGAPARPPGPAPAGDVAPPPPAHMPAPRAQPAGPPQDGAGAATPRAATPAEPPFDPAGLPPIESLTAATDIRAFLRKEVPEALKRAALRRAWSLDPAIRDFVGPADYAWDYNAPDGVPGGSLDLVGDVREMLAQVFGPEAAPDDAAAPGRDVAAAPEAASEGAEAAQRTLPAGGPTARAGDGAAPPPDEHPAVPAAAAENPAPAPPPPATPPRRHGSALPS